jgi:hypothetical protein
MERVPTLPKDPPVGDDLVARILDARVHRPSAVAEAAASRPRRRSVLGARGQLLILAADHPARGSLRAGDRPLAMGDRGELLRRLCVALDRPGVDGVLGTADVIEDLLLLGALDDKLVFGSMNRGGLAWTVFELDDRFTAYDADAIAAGGLDGGKMLLRLALNDPGTAATLEGCARAVSALAARKLVAMVEPLPACREADGTVSISKHPDELMKAIGVASGLGTT